MKYKIKFTYCFYRTILLTLSCILFFLHTQAQSLTFEDELKQRAQVSQRYEDSLKQRFFQHGGALPRAAVGSIQVNENAAYVNYTPKDLVEKIFAKGAGCILVKNITFRGMGWNGGSWTGNADNRGLSYFHKGSSNFPITEGLLLSTGAGVQAEGPNNSANAMSGGVNISGDSDLNGLLPSSSSSVTSGSILEFDFIPSTTSMEFKYIFASEEYPEYVHSQFNDVFGFFVNKVGGPKQNIARLPTTNSGRYEVSINNVNKGRKSSNTDTSPGENPKNSNYFITNIQGSLGTQFDGYTVVLTARYTNLQPCQTYHLKLGVANVGDQSYGSGVFLQAQSFDAGGNFEQYGNGIAGFSKVFEGCTNNKLVFTRSSTATQQTMQYSITGTATNGVDFIKPGGGALPTSVVFPVGVSTIEVPYQVVNDGIADNGEWFKVTLFCPCAGMEVSAEKTIYIYEFAAIQSVSTTPACFGSNNGSIIIYGSGGSGAYEYALNSGPWTTNKVFSNLSAGTYTVKMRDIGSCDVKSQKVTVNGLADINLQVSGNSICKGSAASLTASSTSFTTPIFHWYSDPSLTILLGTGANFTTPALNANTTYYLKVSAINSPCAKSMPVTVTVNNPPVISSNFSSSSFCPTVVVPAQNIIGTAGATFEWTNNNTTIGLGASGVGNIPSFTTQNLGTTSIIATITVTPVLGSCKGASKSYTVTVYPKPPQPTVTANGSLSFCAGGSVQLTSSAPNNNQWYKDNVVISGSVGKEQTYTVTSSGSYTVKVTNSQGCESISSPAQIVTVHPRPTAPTITIDKNSACQGETIVLTSSLNALSFQWYHNGVLIPGAQSKTYTASLSGNYQVELTDNNGCTSFKSASVDITFIPKPTASISGSKVICETSSPTSLEVNFTGTPPWTITYTANGVNPIIINNILTSPYTISGLKPASTTTYTITTVQDSRGCNNSGTGSGTVYVQPCGFGTPMMIWLKANEGAEHTAGVMTYWKDQSGSGSELNPAQTQSGNEIVLKDKAINFNPSVSFPGKASHFMEGTTKEYFPGIYTMFTVTKKGKNENTQERKGVFTSYKGSNPDGQMGPGLVYMEQSSDRYYAIDGVNTDKNKAASTFGMAGSLGIPNLIQAVNQTPAGSTENSLIYMNGKINTLIYGPAYSLISGETKTFAVGGRRTGIFDNTSNFDGEIAEIIFFPNMLSSDDINKSVSYLAVKYGIHLHEKDYVSSDGNIVWSYLGNISYNSEVAGLAHDHGYALDQRIAKNENPGTDNLIVCRGTNFKTNMNEAPISNIDKSYLMWGNNSGAKSFGILNDQRYLFQRIWRVQLSGKSRDTVSLQFDLSGISLPEGKRTISLLVASVPNFKDGYVLSKHTAILDVDNKLTVEKVILNNGNYFTLAVDHLPLGLSEMSLWLRADKDVTGKPLINTWKDQTSALDIYSNKGSANYYHTSDQHINFNPLVRFSGNDTKDYFEGRASIKLAQTFVVSAFGLADLQNGTNSGALIGEKSQTGYLYRDGPEGISFRTHNKPYNFALKEQGVHLHGYKAGETDVNAYYEDGNENALSGLGVVSSSTDIRLIGAYMGNLSINDPTAYFKGDLAEIVGFSNHLEEENRSKVESYLAIKYGITLNKDYHASDGSKSWNYTLNSAFRFHITGIGRDDDLRLDQRVSRNIQPGKDILTLANGVDFPMGNFNAQTPEPIGVDKSFLIWSSNNGAITFNSTPKNTPEGVIYLLDRKWMIQKKGSGISNVSVQFDTTGTNMKFPEKVGKCRKILLLTSTEAEFATVSLRGISEVSADGKINFENIHLNDYFTLCVLEVDAHITGTSEQTCSPDPNFRFDLKAHLGSGETGEWSLKSITGGLASGVMINSPSSKETYVTLPVQGNMDLIATFQWKVTNTYTGCTDSAFIEMRRYARPNKPGVSADVEYCQQATAVPLVAASWPEYSLWWFKKENGIGTALGSIAPTPSTTLAGNYIYQVIQKHDILGCESDTSEIKVRVLPVSKHPDVRIHLCSDPDRSIPLSKFLDTVNYLTVNWTTITSGAPTPVGSAGVINTLGLVDRVYAYSYAYETKCYTSKAKIYLHPIKGQIKHTLVDTLVVCKETAGNINLDQVLGLEANGYWTFNPVLNKYVNVIQPPSVMAGGVILEAHRVYSAIDLALFRKTYKTDPNAVHILFEYHPQSSCADVDTKKLLIIVTEEL